MTLPNRALQTDLVLAGARNQAAERQRRWTAPLYKVRVLGPRRQDVLSCLPMHFEVVGEITSIQTIAVGSAIRDIARLRRQFDPGRWRKLKGTATVQLAGGTIRQAEVHWYEASGIGRRRMKIKQFLD